MKKIEQYLVGEHTFSDEKFASKVEPLIDAYPEFEFVSDDNELHLPIKTWRGEAKIFISNDVLELQLITHDPWMSSSQIFGETGTPEESDETGEIKITLGSSENQNLKKIFED